MFNICARAYINKTLKKKKKKTIIDKETKSAKSEIALGNN